MADGVVERTVDKSIVGIRKEDLGMQAMYATKDPSVFLKPIDGRVQVPIDDMPIQALYAVKDPNTGLCLPVYDDNEVRPAPIEALYAVKDPVYTSPVGGTGTTGGMDLNITYNQLEENIATLKNSISKLKDSWSNETQKNIATLDNSWVGEDCTAYTSKLTSMDNKVQKTISALELLCSTYEKARDMIKDNQSSVMASIDNLN